MLRLIVLILIICALTVAAYKVLPSTFVPNKDSGYFLAAVSLPEGTSLNRTYELMSTLSDEIQQVPGFLNVMKIAGYDALSSGSKPNSGAIFVGLNTWSERTTKELSITNIIQEVNKLGKKHPEAMIINVPNCREFALLIRLTHQFAILNSIAKKQSNSA